jgi:hypothetical protein
MTSGIFIAASANMKVNATRVAARINVVDIAISITVDAGIRDVGGVSRGLDRQIAIKSNCVSTNVVVIRDDIVRGARPDSFQISSRSQRDKVTSDSGAIPIMDDDGSIDSIVPSPALDTRVNHERVTISAIRKTVIGVLNVHRGSSRIG